MQVETLTFDQVHLGVPDPEAAARWYVQHLGAAPGDHVDRVWFGSTRIIFLKNPTPAPSHAAAIDHFALAVADVSDTVKALEHASVRVTGAVGRVPSDPPGTRVQPASARASAVRRSLGDVYRSAFIEDPWGAKIQLVEEPEALGFHHVHLRVPDPERARTWYLERFGGTRATLKGQLDGIQYGSVWLFLEEGASVPSRGHTIDHVGWRMPDLLAKAAELKAKDVTFTVEPHAGPQAPHAPVLMSFAEDPWGVKIELLQRREAVAV